MDFSILLSALPEIRSWLTSVMDRRQARRQEKQQVDEREEAAVAALNNALNETQIYLGSMQRNESHGKGITRNYETEAALSRLWNSASVKLRNYDPDLSRRLRVKGEYWTNPDAWSENDIKHARIQITQVLDSASSLLHGETEG